MGNKQFKNRIPVNSAIKIELDNKLKELSKKTRIAKSKLLDEAVEIIKRDSRRYAKRQITWFKRYENSKWFDLDKYDDKKILKEEILDYIENISKNV